jgi:hypothetical protein
MIFVSILEKKRDILLHPQPQEPKSGISRIEKRNRSFGRKANVLLLKRLFCFGVRGIAGRIRGYGAHLDFGIVKKTLANARRINAKGPHNPGPCAMDFAG